MPLFVHKFIRLVRARRATGAVSRYIGRFSNPSKATDINEPRIDCPKVIPEVVTEEGIREVAVYYVKGTYRRHTNTRDPSKL